MMSVSHTTSLLLSRRVASRALTISRTSVRRWKTTEPTTVAAAAKTTTTTTKSSFWTNAETWGFMSALAGWTMSIAAISDSVTQGPEVISLSMTSVLVVYSSLFLRWSFVVRPQNLFLAACHFTNICAQLNQGRRAIEYKWANDQRDEVEAIAKQVGMVGAVMGGSILLGPPLQRAILAQTATIPQTISKIAASDAGPFRVHFWAPMSKWLISGASLMDYNRPTARISISQYSSLSLCGCIHAWYALLVTPVNYMLCSVNVALLISSGWHLGRKLKADYYDIEENNNNNNNKTTTTTMTNE